MPLIGRRIPEVYQLAVLPAASQAASWFLWLIAGAWTALFLFMTVVPFEEAWYGASFSIGIVRLNPVTLSTLVLGMIGLYGLVHTVRNWRERWLWPNWTLLTWTMFGVVLVNGFLRGNPGKLSATDFLSFLVLSLFFVDLRGYWRFMERVIVLHAIISTMIAAYYVLTHQFLDRGDYFFSEAVSIFDGLYLWGYFWFTWSRGDRWRRRLTVAMMFLSFYGVVISETRGLIVVWVLTFLVGLVITGLRSSIFRLGFVLALLAIVLELAAPDVLTPVWEHLQNTFERHEAITNNPYRYGSFGMTGRIEEVYAFWDQLSPVEKFTGRGAGGHWFRAAIYINPNWDDYLANLQEPDLHIAYGTMVLKGGIVLMILYSTLVFLAGLRGIRSPDPILKALGWFCVVALVSWVGPGVPWSYKPSGIFWAISIGLLMSRGAAPSVHLVSSVKTRLDTQSHSLRLRFGQRGPTR
jgi:hypothetical protein